jgi:hypothetical protein
VLILSLLPEAHITRAESRLRVCPSGLWCPILQRFLASERKFFELQLGCRFALPVAGYDQVLSPKAKEAVLSCLGVGNPTGSIHTVFGSIGRPRRNVEQNMAGRSLCQVLGRSA